MREVLVDRRVALYSEEDSKTKADREIIDSLVQGNLELTVSLTKEIYYKIKLYDIEFESMLGIDFLDSLTEILTEEQMRNIRRQVTSLKRREDNKQKLFARNKGMLVFVFALVFCICFAYFNWNVFLDMKTNYDTYLLQEKVKEDARTARLTQRWQDRKEAEALAKAMEEEQTALASSVTEVKPEILGKFQQLYSENQDFSGWLMIDGTKIDYPVMSRQNDNNYYLDKNFTGEKDKNGLLILDYRCDVMQSGQNLIIYGHNMRSGVMFGTLKKYKDKQFCKEHPTIHFDSLYEENEYKVVAAMLSEVAYADEDVFRYYDAIDMSTEQEFETFKDNISGNALYMMDELSYGDSYLILSTCDRYKEDGRFVVIAKKIQK